MSRSSTEASFGITQWASSHLSTGAGERAGLDDLYLDYLRSCIEEGLEVESEKTFLSVLRSAGFGFDGAKLAEQEQVSA
jgi:hypothetical protein